MSKGGNHILRSVLLLLLASGLAFGLTLGARELFPSLEVKVFNPLSDLFPTPGGDRRPVEVAPETPRVDPLLAELMREDSIAHAEQDDPTTELTDSIDEVRPDSLLAAASRHAADIPTGTTDYSGGENIRRLRSLLAGAGEEPVNIAFLGDSFIEGDILVAHFRRALQAAYGGAGVGYVPMTSVTARFRQTIKHRFSGEWEEDDALKSPRGEHFLITGSYERPVGSAEVEYTNVAPTGLATLLYSATDSTTFSTEVNGGEPVGEMITPTSGQLRSLVLGHQVSSLKLSFPSAADIRLYGVLMDGETGVRVDNMSLRGSSGMQLGSVSTVLSQGLHSIRPYHLIVLAYGLNVVSPEDVDNNYGYYFRGMDRVLSRLHELYPEALFLILSISDRGEIYDGEVYTIPGVPRMVEVQNRLARKYGALFFNTYGTMKEMGGIEDFVSKGWAAKDYTHLSSAGGRVIAKRMVSDLTETDITELTRSKAETAIEESILPETAQDSTRMTPADSTRYDMPIGDRSGETPFTSDSTSTATR